MNLDEFRKAMESDATVENERLKRDLADVEKRYHEMFEVENERLKRDIAECEKRYRELSDYFCKHVLSIDDKVKAAKKLMEETNNA